MIKRIFIVFILWFFIHLCFMLYFGLLDEINKSDAAVVYGNQVENDGAPSIRLQSRLDRAIELYNEKYFKYIIVSGAIDKNHHDESKIMAEYLISKGIPESAVIEDNAGTNTMLTAMNVRMISRNYGFKSILVISQYYHILRVKLSLYKVGIEDVNHAHAIMFPESRDFYYIPREFGAFYAYLLK